MPPWISRIAAFGVLCNIPHGFFMNWYGDQKGEGFEVHILAAGLALVVLVRGGGAMSVDRLVSRDRD